MIQLQTKLDIADNTGAREAMCIRMLGGSTARNSYTRRAAGVGDVIVVSIKKALPNSDIKAGELHRCVIVRTAHPVRRPDGSYIRFDKNAAVLIDEDGNPRGTRIFGAVARELREKNFLKIISLASEVV